MMMSVDECRSMLTEPRKGVGDLFCIGGSFPDTIAQVVVKGRANIPTFYGVRSPCFSYIGFS
jgi:hypothetical protein